MVFSIVRVSAMSDCANGCNLSNFTAVPTICNVLVRTVTTWTDLYHKQELPWPSSNLQKIEARGFEHRGFVSKRCPWQGRFSAFVCSAAFCSLEQLKSSQQSPLLTWKTACLASCSTLVPSLQWYRPVRFPHHWLSRNEQL